MAPPAAASNSAAAATPAKPRKLSYKEQRELDELPSRIEALEAEQSALNARLADPEAYRKEGSKVAELHERVQAIDTELMTLLERWETLSR